MRRRDARAVAKRHAEKVLSGELARGSPFAWAGLAAMLASVYVVARVVVWFRATLSVGAAGPSAGALAYATMRVAASAMIEMDSDAPRK